MIPGSGSASGRNASARPGWRRLAPLGSALVPLLACNPLDDTPSAPPDGSDTPTPTNTSPLVPVEPVEPVEPVDPGCGGVLPAPARAPEAPEGLAFTAEPLEVGERAACVWIDDLDGDGHTDHGWFRQADGGTAWFRWGGPEGSTTSLTLPQGTLGGQGACTLADRDADGRLDVLFTRDHDVGALDQIAPRTFVLQTGLADLAAVPPGAWGPQWLAAVDLDGLNGPDLLAGFYGERLTSCVAPESLEAPDTTIELAPGSAVCLIADGEGRYGPDTEGRCPSPTLAAPTPFCNGASLSDLDGDGATDLFLQGDFAPNELLPGRPEGGFGRGAGPVGVEVYNHAMGSAIADFDGDGRLDVFVTDAGTNDLYGQALCGQFFQQSGAVGLDLLTGRTVTWGVSSRDFDHNGAPDLLVGMSLELGEEAAAGDLCELAEDLPYPPSLLLLNDGEAHFTRVDVPDLFPAPGSAWFGGVRIATGDLDDDGDDDAIVSTTYGTTLLRNVLPPKGTWLRVRALDAAGRPALGARIVARQEAGGRVVDLWSDYGFSGHSELTAAFGFANDAPVTVEVRWPDGATVTLPDQATGQRLVIAHPTP